jgi:Mg-chelatase subunit ChlD
MLKRLIASVSVASVVAGGAMATPGALAAGDRSERPRMDLAFCIDTTSSMQGEIDMVKTKVKELVAKLSSGKPAPEIRVGLVAYRDRGDEYVTKVFPFSDDIDKVVKDISSLQARGGGDGPEAVNQGLHSAIHDLKWDASKKAAKLVFLIGDAGPNKYPGDFDWHQECREAISHGIQINAIGCNGLEAYPSGQGVDVFQGIAKLTDGKYETLAYHHEVTSADGKKETYISSAGSLYKVRSADKNAWRAGAATLAAGGRAERVDTPVALAKPKASFYRAPVMSMSAAPMPASSSGFGTSVSTRAYGGGAASSLAVERKDNNLADVLLEGARSAVRKKTGVEFEK